MPNMPFSPPPGMVSDETVFAAPGRWRRGSWVRFWENNWQIKGGWERLVIGLLGGVCRTVFGWQDRLEQPTLAFGLHNGLKYWQAGSNFIDITPTLQGVATAVTLANSTSTPIMTTSGDVKVRVVLFNHGLVVGQNVRLAGFTQPVGGINPNGDWVVVTGAFSDVNNFYFTASVAPSATASGGGLNGTVQVTPFVGFTVGQIDGTGGAGFGTGGYGIGTYGTPSTDAYYPLTWALASYGGDLMANPRGQTIFTYTVGNPLAVPLAGAPPRVTFMVVTPSRQVLALGCNQSVDGVFNPLAIRWSDIEGPTTWTETSANNAGEWVLEGGGRIVCGRVVGDYVLVWTTASLFLGTFIGDPGQTWKFEKVGANCGAIGPNAPVIKSQNAAWIAPDRQLWTYSLGAQPVILDCPIRNMFMDHISQGQDDKVVGATLSSYGEISWFYPDARDGLECSRAITVGSGGWYPDLIARSAFVDAGPLLNPIGVDPAGNAYWHEKGQSADGAILQGYLESTDFYVGQAEGGVIVNGVWPDFKSQVGMLQLTIYGRQYPQSNERTYGPWTLPPGLSQKSFRMSARIARVRLDFASAPCYARGGAPQFDVAAIGGR